MGHGELWGRKEIYAAEIMILNSKKSELGKLKAGNVM